MDLPIISSGFEMAAGIRGLEKSLYRQWEQNLNGVTNKNNNMIIIWFGDTDAISHLTNVILTQNIHVHIFCVIYSIKRH